MNLQIFKNEKFTVRTSVVEDKPYFCLTDVCEILSLTNPAKVSQRLNKGGVTTSYTVDKLGRRNLLTFISESNLYKVIFQSRKPEAEKFTEWVTSEVLPSIRKNGAYMTPDVLQKSIADPGYVIGLLQKLKDDKPKVEMAERLMLADSCVNVAQFAQTLRTGRNRLYRILKEQRILKPNREPYQYYVDRKYIEVKEVPKNGRIFMMPLITTKGQDYLLKKIGDLI